jgi:hypothetical protein
VTQGGSFLAGPGESGRRALLDVERRLGSLQATIDSLSPAHGDLTGLGDDDHPQYLTTARGDARYYTESESDSLFAPASHSHSYLPLSGGTLTGDLVITGISPQIKFNDTSSGADDFWIHVNGNRLYILADRDDNNSWDGAYPLELNASTNIGYCFGGQIWTSTNDGAGSGLDADLLDGLSSASFLRSDANDSHSGTLTLDVVSVGNEIQLANGSATDPPLTFSSDGNTGIWRPGTDRLGCVAGGVTAEFRTDGLHLASGDWFRSYGTTGWYNGTYGGGMYMIDSSWVRVYNGKNFYVPGSIQTAIQLQSTRSSTGNVGNASLNIGMGNGNGVIAAWNCNGYAPLITIGRGEIFYCRNYLNSSWAGMQGYLVNHSSVHSKENIVALGDVPLSAGAAANTLEAFDAMEMVRKLRPVSYYWKEQDALPRMPINEDGSPNQRRIDALCRLNKIRESRGMGEFRADYLRHQCGRDCDHTIDNPCWQVRNYITGKIGFISQEVGEILPQAAELSEGRNEFEAIDTLALVAVLTKALQQMDDRVTHLEGAE